MDIQFVLDPYNVSNLEQMSEKDEYEMKGGITLVKRQKPRIMLYTAWRN